VATPFSGVAQAATITGPTAAGSSAAALTVASNTGDMVLDAVSEFGAGGAAGDPGAGQTLQGKFIAGQDFGGVSTASGATSVPMSWSLNGNGQYYTHAAIDIPATTTALIAPSITYGTNASINVLVSSGAGTATGNVSLTVDGGTPLTQALSGGSSVFSVPGLQAGKHNLSASYVAPGTLDTSSTTGTLTVNPATLTITPTAGQSNVYGAAVPALTYTPNGFVNGDSATLLSGLLRTTATAASLVGTYAFTLGTLTAGNNYMLALSANPPTLVITPAPLTITPTAGQSKVYGAAEPTLTYTASGLANNDPLSTITGALGTTATAASPVGNYPISLGTLVAGNNYTVVLAANPPSFAITPAPLTVTADNQVMPPGGTVPAFTYHYTGLLNGDSSAAFTGSLATTATSSSAAGSYPITQGTLAATGNYSIGTFHPGTLTVLGSGVTLVGTTLFIVSGSSSNDQVLVTPVGSSTTGSTGVQVKAVLNHAASTTTFTQSGLSLQIYGYSGNDTIVLDPRLTVTAAISAGNGNDGVAAGAATVTVTLGNGNDAVELGDGNNTVTLGNGNDDVLVGNGNNVVVTGNGNDAIGAGNGDNLIVAGLGHHAVVVGNGSNILIDGSVTLTQSDDSLRHVLNEWIQSGKNAAASIRAELAVTDNTNNANTMLAGSGLDWFWETYSKDTTNRKPGDLLN
jgi:hypothetical protein